VFILRIRNWDKFQHYKPMHSKYKKQMTWLKLYGGDILNDIDWFELSDTNKAIYIELLCLASQNHGNIPELKTISFRLRRPIDQLQRALEELAHFIEDGIYSVYTMPILEEEKEEEKEQEEKVSKEFLESTFNKFWEFYPNKQGIARAKEYWKSKKLYKYVDDIIKHINYMKTTQQWKDKQFIPHGSTYLNKRLWEDGITKPTIKGRVL